MDARPPHYYGRWTCPSCGRTMARAGAPVASHQRKHVREGRLVEMFKWPFRNVFVPPEEVAGRKEDGWSVWDQSDGGATGEGW